ncbi:MAG: DUF1015 domain-containing protein [Acutalibacteraceae bacterium]|nr:DUF1015 domain-containing protein [Acutalibacteraceae bacterium]
MKKYLYPADILLPKNGFEKWSVIACDQYTSDSKYWSEVEKLVGSSPSTLHLVLPEIYLSETQNRVENINASMKKYLESDVFVCENNCMVYIEREITGGAVRKGVLGLLDLEDYKYESGSKTLTRATEQTVASRIPPRVAIRKDAPLEFPHVLIFIDDPDDTVMQTVSSKKNTLKKLYDFELMQNGGHIEGYRIDESEQDDINKALSALIKDGLLFAVGDGNHSLATAKECYNQNKNELARYALVEIVNIHNPAIEFEPIYRVLFGVNKAEVMDYLIKRNSDVAGEKSHNFIVIDSSGEEMLSLVPTSKLPVGTLQGYLDDYLSEHPEVEIDYIHGIDATKQLCETESTVGFIFDGMKKDELFDAVILDGSLPRKTFSMGHADDKRFYLEGRRIK